MASFMSASGLLRIESNNHMYVRGSDEIAFNSALHASEWRVRGRAIHSLTYTRRVQDQMPMPMVFFLWRATCSGGSIGGLGDGTHHDEHERVPTNRQKVSIKALNHKSAPTTR